MLRFLLLLSFLALASGQSALDRRSAISDDNFVLNLVNANATVGNGGASRNIGGKQFPLLQGSGLAIAHVTLLPCGINLPHVHPRANEILYMISGSDLQTAFAEENPSNRVVVNSLSPGDVTLFPMGLIHYQQNLGCENVTFVTVLSNEDPGTVTIATHLFDFPTEAAASALNINASLAGTLKGGLQKNPGLGRIECLAKCSATPTDSTNTTTASPTNITDSMNSTALPVIRCI